MNEKVENIICPSCKSHNMQDIPEYHFLKAFMFYNIKLSFKNSAFH